MISVEEALALVTAAVEAKPAVNVALGEAHGLVLAEAALADRDIPPFDKAMVDGYAVAADDLVGRKARLRVLEEVVAGDTPTKSIEPGTATRIMTGAPVPPGASGVVMIEQSTLGERDGTVLLDTKESVPGQHVLRRGSLLTAGVEAVSAGCPLGGAQIGLLAEIGCSTVRAVPRSRVAVLATGNELVPADQTPGKGQIRNSNGPMLTAALAECGAVPVDLGIAVDEPDDLGEKIARGLETDVLLLSGGVSAGVLDLVPQVLSESGVREVFHKVGLKPGKPLWFGTHSSHDSSRGDARKTLVFGLPGNPVSSWVCYTLFVRPALAQLSGRDDRDTHTRARLTEPYTPRRPRPTYHPAILDEHTAESTVRLTEWRGSADLAAFIRANCLAVLPMGDEPISKGETLDVVRC